MKDVIHKKQIRIMLVMISIFLLILPSINAVSVNVKSNNTFLQKISFENTDYDLFIIAPRAFSIWLKPLESFKNKMGVKTVIVPLEDIYSCSENQGRDDAEKIKYFIKEGIENWNIKYVLLVGGQKGQTKSWYLPARYVHTGNSWESEILCDLYYADIYNSEGGFSSWDSDGDGKYAEWWYGDQPEDTGIDFYPDVAVGRLPCRNFIEVKIIVDKIINYESEKTDKDWFNSFLGIAGDTYPEIYDPLWVGYEGEYYVDKAIENMSGFTPTRLYTSDGSLTGYNDIINSYNQGFGFVYFCGHGNPMSWSTHLPNSNKWIQSFQVTEISQLKNGGKQPICVIGGCHNLQFDVSVFNYFDEVKRFRGEYTPECMGWWMTRKADGGNIATLGCTALGYTKEDKVLFKGGSEELEVQFFKQIGQNNVDILGDAWANAISWYVDTYPVPWDDISLTNDSWIDQEVIQTWVLMGDPSLKIGGY